MLLFNFTPFPVLYTSRFVLQQITHNNAKDMFLLRSNPATMKFIPREIPKNIEEALQHIDYMQELLEQNECINWGIHFINSDTLIGTIGYFRFQPENHRAEIGYMLNPLYHRQGIMQEVLHEVIGFGFKTMKLHSIEAITDPENYPSWKLLEKIGFIREGHFKEDCYWQGKYLDSYVYSLLNK